MTKEKNIVTIRFSGDVYKQSEFEDMVIKAIKNVVVDFEPTINREIKMGSKSICILALSGLCECDGEDCQGKIAFNLNLELVHEPDYYAFKTWFYNLGTQTVPIDAYTKEGLAQVAFFAGMQHIERMNKPE